MCYNELYTYKTTYGGGNMKTTIKQILGYIIILTIITSIIWFMMYKLNEKLKLEQGNKSAVEKVLLI